ncbi:hypothetical protein BX266_6496 [Streptomyces sp. TLI_171]|nr:hypothetical protein BX266_6496 [Streptomyces sp. TLI_171]
MRHSNATTVKTACRVTTTSQRLHIDLLRVTTALCSARAR